MRWSYRLGLAAAFLLQVGLVAWIVGDRALVLARGTEIRLPVIPVDPRDLLRGDYVILSYPISRLKSADVAGDNLFNFDDRIYVSIVPEGEGWKATGIHHAPPEGEGMYLRGRVTGIANDSDCTADCETYTVDYNLEQFFVPEGTGREIETLRNDQRVSVDVAVGAGGRAQLKRLLVDGVVRYDEPLY